MALCVVGGVPHQIAVVNPRNSSRQRLLELPPTSIGGGGKLINSPTIALRGAGRCCQHTQHTNRYLPEILLKECCGSIHENLLNEHAIYHMCFQDRYTQEEEELQEMSNLLWKWRC